MSAAVTNLKVGVPGSLVGSLGKRAIQHFAAAAEPPFVSSAFEYAVQQQQCWDHSSLCFIESLVKPVRAQGDVHLEHLNNIKPEEVTSDQSTDCSELTPSWWTEDGADPWDGAPVETAPWTSVQCDVDDLTSVPEDLFQNLLRAGSEARHRGQHRRAHGTRRLIAVSSEPVSLEHLATARPEPIVAWKRCLAACPAFAAPMPPAPSA